MEKREPAGAQNKRSNRPLFRTTVVVGAICVAALYHLRPGFNNISVDTKLRSKCSPYGRFPKQNDPFRFIPCTNASLPPALGDADPEKAWAKLFDPNPEHWSWGNKTSDQTSPEDVRDDPYSGRGIYLCGYLDLPLDYTNVSDARSVRLAVTKFQVSGLSRAGARHSSSKPAGAKSARTLVIEPGGPGGSGTAYAWRAAELVTRRLSGGRYDVLGWDPRGVNASLPAVACFPYDADRDRWSRLAGQYREAAAAGARAQLELADAMGEAVMRACWERHGDFARFVGTSFVARDMEEIRKALGEDELTGYLVSYGTGIGQTYANMFPDSVGRMILDGTEYVRDHRVLGGFGRTSLDNATDAWHDGFLGECLNAGPLHCALAAAKGGKRVTLKDLEARMAALVSSLIRRPAVGYTKSSGPSLITYEELVVSIYGSLYNAKSWPALAQMLSELEDGNSTLAAAFLERNEWGYDPAKPPACGTPPPKPSSRELMWFVVCADSYDAPQPRDGLDWWEVLWRNMTTKSWISGNSRFLGVLPCRHFGRHWPRPAEVYRGDLNHTLRHPVLLVAETHDPATPLRNGRRLLAEMGRNARLVVHNGYGHSSGDKSSCTDSIAKEFILHGTLPDEQETACYADEKPYLYGVKAAGAAVPAVSQSPVEAWREHLRELAFLHPGLLSMP
jgi:pimeloyl-ACP methyl ester carboxylesterase